MSSTSSWAGSGSNGLKKRPGNVCRYGPGAGGAGLGSAMRSTVVTRRLCPVPDIRRGGPEDLDRLEPLWVSVHHRHVESMPDLAPYVDDAATWAARRALYAELLAKPDTVLLLASAGDALVGYGL